MTHKPERAGSMMIELYWMVFFPIIIGMLVYFLPAKCSSIVTVICQLIQFIGAILLIIYCNQNGTVIQNIGYWPSYVGITLQADWLSAIMVFLTSFLFLMTGIFGFGAKYADRLFLFLTLILEGLIVGIFLSRDLFNIFVLVEISVVVVSILIMTKKDAESIYDGIIYLLTNTVSMTMYLFGIAILYKQTGLCDMEGITRAIRLINQPKAFILPYALLLTAVSLKAALMPLFSWLPRAHATPSAPSSVSAILSGIYVKIGIYLFIRMQAIFSNQIDTRKLFLVLGFITAMIGFVFVLLQHDIKLMLAYSTVSQIGLIMFGLNMGSEISYTGALFHIMNHAIFKMTLFLTAGMVIEEYHTRDIREIRGVFRRMPIVSITSIMAILSITGAPLFSGSISKYMIGDTPNLIQKNALLFLNFGTILAFVKYSTMFLKNDSKKSIKKESVMTNNRTGIVLAGGLCTLLGGLLSTYLLSVFYHFELHISILGYIEKAFQYLVMTFIACFIYFIWTKKSKYHFEYKMELTFNQICMAIFSFFFFLVIYLNMAIS